MLIPVSFLDKIATRSISLIALLMMTCIALSAQQPHSAATNTKAATAISWTPLRVTNGAPVIFKLQASRAFKSVSAKWIGHEVRFFRGPKKNTWYGFGGVDVEVPKGKYDLEITAKTKDGVAQSFRRTVVVYPTRYPKVTLNVPQRFVEPSPEEVQEIDRDKEIKKVAFVKGEMAPEWSGDFAMPVEAPASDSFGTARVFNGKVASVHRGTDFRVPSGTEVRASNDGTVVLAQPLFFEGGCVMIDHGEGLKTIYMHLSDFRVKAGEQVKKGQVIAISGGTGRATGPHLHMAVRWEGTYLDPTKLLKLKMPDHQE